MKIRSWVMVFGLALCLLSRASAAGQFEDAGAAYNRGDYATALQLLRPLADKGDADAQQSLGFMYRNGHGTPQDFAKAAKWYRLAAAQGNLFAEHGLGVLYENGQGVPQDFSEAAKWIRKAADHGHAPAQIKLSMMYGQGSIVPQDYVLAHMWINLGIAALPPADAKMREIVARVRDNIATKMTPNQIADAQRLAREWLAAHPKP